MFSSTITVLAVAGLVTLSVGALVYTLFFNKISGRAIADQRVNRIAQAPARSSTDRRAQVETNQRRKNIQTTLKDIEAKQKKKKGSAPPLSLRIERAGLKWTKQTFFIFSAVCGVVAFVFSFFSGMPLYLSGAIAFVGLLGFPRWLLGFLAKRRQAKFLNELPNAVDVIIRGVKSGLPVGDCLRIIASEAAEPVRGEFKYIVEAQAVGVPLSEAVTKVYEHMPLAEANFFAIVIGVQQQAGGNLSEALSNLSKVLRERKKMKGKIQAMSTEAKASGAIIGSLPLIVTCLVYLTTPSYIMLLFTTQSGNVILVASGLWMLTGILVMKKMINFDF